jgi:hypothetical protein
MWRRGGGGDVGIHGGGEGVGILLAKWFQHFDNFELKFIDCP